MANLPELRFAGKFFGLKIIPILPLHEKRFPVIIFVAATRYLIRMASTEFLYRISSQANQFVLTTF